MMIPLIINTILLCDLLQKKKTITFVLIATIIVYCFTLISPLPFESMAGTPVVFVPIQIIISLVFVIMFVRIQKKLKDLELKFLHSLYH